MLQVIGNEKYVEKVIGNEKYVASHLLIAQPCVYNILWVV
jgi:hypothetical protein